MEMKMINGMILAEDYDSLVDWYIRTFELSKKGAVHDDDYHYTELASKGGLMIGIARADEMGVTPHKPRRNTVVIQISVSDINFLFAHVKANGGRIVFGPTKDDYNEFTYGGITDPEGNEIWVIEEKIDDEIPKGLHLG